MAVPYVNNGLYQSQLFVAFSDYYACTVVVLCLTCSLACRASGDIFCSVYLPLGLSIYVV